MGAKVTVRGFSDLTKDIRDIGMALDNDSAAIKRALEAGIEPIYEQMKQNTLTDPKKISGVLHDSIKVGRVVTRRKGGKQIDAGVHRNQMDGDKKAYYANPVEFGHGGPAPAPPHPFVQPAFDLRAEEAYMEIRRVLQNELDEQTR